MIVKRIFDIVVAGSLFIALVPVLPLLAILIRICLGAPVIFRQMRPGLKGRHFELLKFRTMLDLKGLDGEPLPDVERMTRLGNLLRSLSLDELPELVNVLKGEMSLVGPRPLLMEYLELYSPEQARRHDVLPGITGWAQINGRNTIDWESRFELDVWYVEHRNLWLDIKILFLTLHKVIKREGISSEGHVTMPKFTNRNPRPRSEA